MFFPYGFQKNLKQKCFLCDAMASSRDHIPPRSLFSNSARKKLRSDLLTVPACEAHNNALKLDEQYISVLLATGSPDSEEAIQLFDERIIPRGVKGSGKLLATIHEQMKPVLFQRGSGIYERRYKIEMDKQRTQNVMGKIAKGLFWARNGYRLPDDCVLSPHGWNLRLDSNTAAGFAQLPLQFIGNPDVFAFKYGEIGNNRHMVCLAMAFFKSNVVHFVICPKNKIPERRRIIIP